MWRFSTRLCRAAAHLRTTMRDMWCFLLLQRCACRATTPPPCTCVVFSARFAVNRPPSLRPRPSSPLHDVHSFQVPTACMRHAYYRDRYRRPSVACCCATAVLPNSSCAWPQRTPPQQHQPSEPLTFQVAAWCILCVYRKGPAASPRRAHSPTKLARRLLVPSVPCASPACLPPSTGPHNVQVAVCYNDCAHRRQRTAPPLPPTRCVDFVPVRGSTSPRQSRFRSSEAWSTRHVRPSVAPVPVPRHPYRVNEYFDSAFGHFVIRVGQLRGEVCTPHPRQS